MSKLIRFQPFTALAITGLAALTLTLGCEEAAEQVQDAQEGLCCSQFKVGVDAQNLDFGLEGQIDGEFKAVAQAGSTLGAVANGALVDVGVACASMARDMGADGAKIDAAVAKGGPDGTKELCKLATAQISANFSASGKFKSTLAIAFEEPKCSASVNAQLDCEAGCTVSGECEASAELPKCKSGKPPTVQCSGSCEGSASAAVSCTGSCDAKCTGACTGSADLAVDCKGTCEGTCAAGGMTKGSGIQADGSCNGTCEGKCTFAADFEPPKCEGTCEGKCEGSCTAEAGVKIKCDGECKGEFEAPSCEGGGAELDCDVDADCKANCDASVSAKAECTPPSVSVALKTEAALDAAAELELKTALASIKANLPQLLIVVRARGEAFAAGVEASAKASGNIAANLDDLSGEAVLCAPVIYATLVEASANFAVALEASGSIITSLGVK